MADRRRRDRSRKAAEDEAARRAAGVQDGLNTVLRTLQELRADVQGVLAGTPSEFDAARLPQLLAEIDRQVERWIDRADEATRALWRKAFELGPRMIEEPLAAADVRIGAVILPDSLLETVSTYAADKIKGVERDAKAAIERHIRRTVLGGQSPHEAMMGVQGELDGPGPYRFVKFRSETIVRTEIGRIHSQAAEARMEAAAEVVPDLGGEWLWSGKSRAAHRAVNGQKRPMGESFDVAGEKMRYPRDPTASSENTINCGCEKIPWLARWEES